MSQPTQPPAATPPQVPPNPPAAETPPPAPAPVDITNLALSRLGYKIANELPPEPPAEPVVEPPVETPPPAEAPAGETTPPAAPAESSPQGDVTPPVAPPAEPPAPVARVKKKTPAPPPPPPPTAEEIVKGVTDALRPPTPPPPAAPEEPVLTDFDREELELAKFAAQTMPDKYKGQDAKVLQFVKERDAKIQEIIKEEGTFDPQSEAYQKFMRERRPQYQGLDRTKLDRARVRAEVVKEAEIKLAELEKRQERNIRRLEVSPVIHREAGESEKAVLELDDDAVKTYKADPQKALDTDPIEAPIIHAATQDVRVMTEEYLRIANDLVEPSKDNPIHVGLSELVQKQGELLDAMPVEQRTGPDGRVYVSRAAFAKLNAADKARYRTFDDGQVLVLIREFGKNVVTQRLKQERARLEKAGYKRVPATPAPTGAATPPATPPSAVPPKPTNAPKASSTPAGAPPAKPAGKTVPAHLKALGINRES